MNYDVCSETGKRIFATIGEAKEVLIRPDAAYITTEGKRMKRRVKKRKETRTYYCDHCKGFHLTSHSHYKKTKRK